MQELNLPAFQYKLKKHQQRTQIFDSIRRKYVTLTPEEWVRQHFVQFLVNQKQVPASLIAVEMGLKYNQLKKRSDIVVYDKSGSPRLIVECKAPSVKITQNAFDQAARYNMTLKVDYIAVTNGVDHYYCHIDQSKRTYNFIPDLPVYDQF